tara:strand:+ start:909 stop:1409 length:501 start_codon:yes stop_codon:yes gene_type:complete
MVTRLCYSLLLFTTIAAADVYKSVDEDGRVIYTDNPHGKQQVEKVDLPSINSQPAIPITPPKKTDQAMATQYRLSIVSPAHESHIPTGQAEITVRVKLQPKMNSEQRIQLLLNGRAFGPASKTPNIRLSDVYRGEHQLAARLQDSQGKTLAQSASITLYVKRTSQQ